MTNQIPCEICRDLMPLVRDGVASPESREAVLAHIRDCPGCRAEWEDAPPPPVRMDEKRVASRLRRGLFRWVLALVGLGTLLGLSLSEGNGMFYNILLLPALGAAACWAMPGKAWLPAPAMAVLTWLWHLVKYWAEGGSPPDIFLRPLYWAAIYGGLCGLGVLIALLLRFAFRKEGHDEKGA
ncbi:MAG TPA: zf-HC2 domain-containing protein [Candidatus Merdivicinus intestinavium]|nr:zf-HC2 domain-containing protein [Candidatus Merdivicinus intestinavium]